MPQIMACKRKLFQKSPVVVGLGPAEARQPTTAKALEQKDHLLEEERGGGGMEGWKEGEHCTEAFESCVSETLAPSQHSQPMCNILPHAAPLTYSAVRAHMGPLW